MPVRALMAPNSPSGVGPGSEPRTTKPKPVARTGSSLSPGANEVSASASRTAAAGEASAVSTVAAVAAPTPAPGPISTALRRTSARNSASAASAPTALIMIAVRCVALTAVAVADPTTVTRPAPTRSAAARAHAGGAGALRRARTPRRRGRAYTCARPCAGRDTAWRHSPGRLTKVRGRDLLQHPLGDADVGQAHLAAQRAPRQQHVPRLQPEERHRAGRLHHRPGAGTRAAVEAARARRRRRPVCPRH